MKVISSAELRGNLKKYLDIAKREKVFIQSGRTEGEEYLSPDESLSQAITAEDLLADIEVDIRERYRKKCK